MGKVLLKLNEVLEDLSKEEKSSDAYGFWVLILMSAMMAINLLIVILINVRGGDNNRQNVNINRVNG